MYHGKVALRKGRKNREHTSRGCAILRPVRAAPMSTERLGGLET